MADEKWLAWEKRSHSRHSDVTTAIRLESEPMKYFQLRGPATPEEIAEEKARRAERQAQSDAEAALRARPEYADAKAIHDCLEFMSPTDHPLDRLTPAEWAELRRKITGVALGDVTDAER